MKRMNKPRCNEIENGIVCNGEIMKMSLKKMQYHNGVWYTLEYNDLEDWLRCEKCQAEYNDSEIKELLK